MLIYAVLQVIVSMLSVLFVFFPVVTAPDSWLDALAYVVGMFNSAMETLPYLRIVWSSFLFIIAFESSLILLKVFLGSRTPAHLN